MTSAESLKEQIANRFQIRLRDVPRLGFPTWAEKFLENENQRFRFRPYQLQIARDLFNPRMQFVALRMFSGAGKTFLNTAAICYAIHQLGASIGKAFPGEKEAKKWMRRKLKPFLDQTPIMGRIGYQKFGDGVLEKRFLNGAEIEASGLNSPGGTRTLELDVMDADEIDAIQQDMSDEGDKLRQFWKRGRGRKHQYHWAASYPSLVGRSKIDSLYDISDRCRWVVECAHCGEPFEMHTNQIRVPKSGDTKKAEIECPTCSRLINDKQRIAMAMAGRWRDKWGHYVADGELPGFDGCRGFHLGCLAHVGAHNEAHASYLAEVASEMQSIETASNKEKARHVFVNTMDAESYAPTSSVKLTANELLDRREDYDPRTVLPEAVLMLTAGGDVQGDRVEFEVVGHGENGETWGCGYYVIHGHTDRPSTWTRVDEFLKNTWNHPLYGSFRPQMTLIDSRYRQAEVLRFTATRGARYGLHPCYGSASANKPAVSAAKRAGKPKQAIYELGTNELKDHVYQAILGAPGEANSMHYPKLDEYDARYFSQLQAEEREWSDGIAVFRNPQQLRNEALDVRCYAVAARMVLNPNFKKLRANLEAKLQPKLARSAKTLPIPQARRKRWI